MSNYVPIKSFKVCEVVQNTEHPHIFNQLADTIPHTEPFSSYEEAQQWIEDNGARQVAYAIIDVFRKP